MEPKSTWMLAEEAFDEALRLPATERVAFVQQRWAAAPAVRDEVLRLLGARERMGDFLEKGALDFRGHRFGAYVADEKIARGGMGVVYAGHRAGGDFEKKVAIKVLLTEAGVTPEAQLLVASDHPNIARLLDAGATDLGFRFLVMEHVEGVPCTEYAGAVTERDKLSLFIQICHAVQAAHQALVVHRDLKPENVLITSDGTPKLLDFGISKLLVVDGRQTSGPPAWTLDCASPEQIRGEPASTANDIYSLGVILCQWLTGRLPHQRSGLSHDALMRQLDLPPQVSLSGDLGAIVRRALAHDPGARYESAGELARDIERYLAGKPVTARPADWRYVAGKYLRRHRYSLAAAALAVIALAAAGGFAYRQAQLAQTRFDQVRSLARSVMFELHDEVTPLPGSARARQMLAERSLRYLDALTQDASLTGETALEIAQGYLRVAHMQRELGHTAARATARKALQWAQRASGPAAQTLQSQASAF